MSPTFQVTCTSCGEERWPMAAVRPVPYLCVRCGSVEPGERARRKENAAKGQKTRRKPPGDTTGAS